MAWRLLPRSSLSPSVPPLLVSFRSDGAGYTVHLTDMAYIWSESLSNEQIIRRTLVEETSIEPQEDFGQLGILLLKIVQSLGGSEDSELQLLREGHDKDLLLRISARLPPPLRPLNWPIHFAHVTQEVLRDKLLLPLLENQLALKQQEASLLAHIKEKDSVIVKLADKLESLGIDLTMIFPGVAGAKTGKKGLGRGRVAKVVPGLASFDEDSWRDDMAKTKFPNGDEDKILSSIFAVELSNSENTVPTRGLKSWWNTLKDKTYETYDNLNMPTKNDREYVLSNPRDSVQENGYESLDHDIDEQFEVGLAFFSQNQTVHLTKRRDKRRLRLKRRTRASRL